MFEVFLNRLAISWALAKPAPDRIPRSLPAAEGLDCYSVYAGGPAEKWPLLVDKIDKNGITGRWWTGDTHDVAASMQNKALTFGQVYISHYVGTHEFRYESVTKFLLQEFFHWPKLVAISNRLNQKLFNRKSLARPDRIKVLRLVFEETIKDRNFSIDPVSLATRLHSYRIFFHPKKSDLLSYYRLLLDSFVESGDLARIQISYRLTSKALSTLTIFETDDRKHQDQLKQQRLIGRLTFALVVVALIQALVTWFSPEKS